MIIVLDTKIPTFGSQQLLELLYLIHYDTFYKILLETDIIRKCDTYIIRSGFYYEMRQFYYKVRHLLQNSLTQHLTKSKKVVEIVFIKLMMMFNDDVSYDRKAFYNVRNILFTV